MKIYKYCCFDKYTRKNLVNNQIYFNNPKKFNDPYEGAHKFDVAVNETIRAKMIQRFCGSDLAYSEYSFEELMNFIVDDGRKAFREKTKVSCFSEINDSLIMWGHYAGNQKGICLEYDSNIGFFDSIKKVSYRKNIYNVVIDDVEVLTNTNSSLKIGMDIVTSKNIDWEYEKEWRLFCPTETLSYPTAALTGLYFGFNTSRRDILNILKITKKIKRLRYYQMRLSREDYNIVFKERSRLYIKDNV